MSRAARSLRVGALFPGPGLSRPGPRTRGLPLRMRGRPAWRTAWTSPRARSRVRYSASLSANDDPVVTSPGGGSAAAGCSGGGMASPRRSSRRVRQAFSARSRFSSRQRSVRRARRGRPRSCKAGRSRGPVRGVDAAFLLGGPGTRRTSDHGGTGRRRPRGHPRDRPVAVFPRSLSPHPGSVWVARHQTMVDLHPQPEGCSCARSIFIVRRPSAWSTRCP